MKRFQEKQRTVKKFIEMILMKNYIIRKIVKKKTKKRIKMISSKRKEVEEKGEGEDKIRIKIKFNKTVIYPWIIMISLSNLRKRKNSNFKKSKIKPMKVLIFQSINTTFLRHLFQNNHKLNTILVNRMRARFSLH